MKRIVLLMFFLFCLIVESLHATDIIFSIRHHESDRTLNLIYPGLTKFSVPIDLNGNGIAKIDKSIKGYVILDYGPFQSKTIWINSGLNMRVNLNVSKEGLDISFSGDNTAINSYLNVTPFGSIQINDASLDEKDYLSKADSLYQSNLLLLKKAKLPSSFNKLERIRLLYYSYHGLPYYKEFYKRFRDNDVLPSLLLYWKKIKKLTVLDNPLLMQISEYRRFILQTVPMLIQHEKLVKDEKSVLQQYVGYLVEHKTCSAVKEYLIQQYIYQLLKRKGVDAITANDLYLYRSIVKSSTFKRQFEELYQKQNSVKQGKPSPDFLANDSLGTEFSLSSFKGKYIYIDVWATWCSPCKKEIPYLEKLKNKYEGKSIYFISLSCDANHRAWSDYVKLHSLNGIQLILKENSSFMNDYQIAGIPRFILLDSDGRILNGNMTRPSDPKTMQILDSLFVR